MPTWLRQIVQRTTADKKKMSAAVLLCALGLLLWGRLLLKEVPRTVVAVPSEAGLGQTEGLSGPIKAEQNTQKPRVYIDLSLDLEIDPFTMDGSLCADSQVPAVVPLQGKSGAGSADTNEYEAALIAAAKGLELQTTVLGDQPSVMINGRLLKTGDKIHGFVIKKIMTREVIVAKEGIEVLLEMD